MVAYVRIQSRVFPVHFATLVSYTYTCLAARDHAGTGLYLQKCSQQAKESDSSSTPPSICQIVFGVLCSILSSTAQDRRDLLQQFHLMPWGLELMMCKKGPRKPGWFSLKKRKQMGKVLLVSSTTYLEDAEKGELGSSQRCDIIGQEATNTCSYKGNSSQIAEKKFSPHGWSEWNRDQSHGTLETLKPQLDKVTAT